MCQTQNRDDQQTNGQDYHKFFICTHNNHPFPQGLGTGESTSPGCPVKHIMLSECFGGAGAGHCGAALVV